MMEKAVVAQKSPYEVNVEAGRNYFWCACGRSQKQPFCDGSHKGTAFVPQQYKAEESTTVWLCGWVIMLTPFPALHLPAAPAVYMAATSTAESARL